MTSCLSMRGPLAGASLPRSRPPLNLPVLLAKQLQGLLVPIGFGVVAAKHGARLLRFLGNAERKIAFDQPFQRLGRVGGRLILVDDAAEAVGGGQPLSRTLIEAADLHLLTGEVVLDEVELDPRVGRVARPGIAADQLSESVRCLLRR